MPAAATAPLPFDAADPRWRAFCSSQGPEVFHSVVSTHDLWKADPFDVEEIHAESREVFARTIARIHNAAPNGAKFSDNAGKILLLRGESGAGKTHLMRAFRHYLHSQGLGWFAYLQMTTDIGHYSLYTLRNLVESFSQPYDLSRGVEESGWLRLSNYLAEHPSVPAELRAELREGDKDDCPTLVFRMADCLIDDPHFERAQVDLDVIRAVLFFQRCEPAFARRACAYLRCDPLTGYDTRFLGGIEPRRAADDPLDMLVQIGRLTHLFEKQALVVCLDQLEDIWTSGPEAEQRFRDSMSAVRALTDKHPNAFVVISCLDDYYEKLHKFVALHKPLLDRIEKEEPRPVVLQSQRSRSEVELMIAKRLECLYESQDAPYREEERLFPFDPREVALLTPLRPRGILHVCREARERSVRTGARPLIDDGATGTGSKSKPEPVPDPIAAGFIQRTEKAWNDFRSNLTTPLPEKEGELAALLAWAIEECNAELNAPASGEHFTARALNTYVQVDTPKIPDTARRWLAGICNASSQSGKLSIQIADLSAAAQQSKPLRVPVAVRSSAFPSGVKTKIAKQIGEMIVKTGGMRAPIEDADWRAIHALREFLPKQTDAAATLAWRAAEKPLSRLPGLRALLKLDKLPVAGRVVLTPESVEKKPDETTKKSDDDSTGKPDVEEVLIPVTGPMLLGTTREAAPKPVMMEANELTRHAAFLGGSGSGKTTVVLALIENLLLRGIPAILLDRKGDLAAYAKPESWTLPLPPGHPPDAEARRRLLRERIDVRLFTPGAPQGGRPLGITLLPHGVNALPGPEREAAARTAAATLGTMMNYRTAAAAQKLAALGIAISTLIELEPEAEITLKRLTDFVASEDESLVNALGHLDVKLLKRLKGDLAAFQVSSGHLLAPGGERVNAERLFGIGDGDDAPPAGKTRLSIISTKFFDNTAGALFWTAQFISEIARFAAKRPSGVLQGVVLFDEADLYLPAVGKPVTKEPMENALRRWRSAGLGVLLASQSPGDFDYKCRDNIRNWFVGRVKEDTALAKMRPMLREAKTDIAAKLPTLEAGQFFVVRDGKVDSLASQRSLIAADQLPDSEILRLASGG